MAAPLIIWVGCSCIMRSSQVMYGSHSAPLIIKTWHLGWSLPTLLLSLTSVGKPAPPRPAIPMSLMCLSNTVGSSLVYSGKLGLLALSGGCSASTFKIKHGSLRPLACGAGRISRAVIVPANGACTGTCILDSGLVKAVPTNTWSPGFTKTSAALPLCWRSGITSSLGCGKLWVWRFEVRSLCSSGVIPPLKELNSPFLILSRILTCYLPLVLRWLVEPWELRRLGKL